MRRSASRASSTGWPAAVTGLTSPARGSSCANPTNTHESAKIRSFSSAKNAWLV